MDNRPTLSPVDYAAWSKGYTPPSEHILIHHLQFSGARVMMSTTIGHGNSQVWVVGCGVTQRKGKQIAILEAVYEAYDAASDSRHQIMTDEDLYGQASSALARRAAGEE